MKKDKQSIEAKIIELDQEIDRLNDECAVKMSEILVDVKGRILSYAKEQEVNAIVERYTQKVAKLVVEKEELEELLK